MLVLWIQGIDVEINSWNIPNPVLALEGHIQKLHRSFSEIERTEV